MKSIEEAWAGVQETLRQMPDVSSTAYETWLAPIKARDIQEGYFVLFVDTLFQRGIILDCYTYKIEKAILKTMGLPLKVRIITGEDSSKAVMNMWKEETLPDRDPEDEPLPDANIPKYEYSFDNFIVGPSNQFAHAAAQSVAKTMLQDPEPLWNPLFIYGESGLGKTHLMYAICNELRRSGKDYNILYVQASVLINEIIEALRSAQPTLMAAVRNKYMAADMLLVDDVQFFTGKEETQMVFFQIFESLKSGNKQIILTSDRPPREIAALADRLRTRFEGGLLADIQPPELETRIAIVKRKAQLLGLDLSDDLAEYIATQLKTNVRQLEGVVRRIMANKLLAGEKPSLAATQSAVREIRSTAQPAPVTVDRIITEVSRTMNVSVDDIRSKKHSANISRARQVAIYVVREVVGSMSMDAIGQEFGGRDHSTVVYTLQKVDKMMESDEAFKGLVKDIIKNVSDT